MKIDKDFAVKVEGIVFTGTEIDKIVIDGGKFNMVCTYVNGSKFEVSAYTKDVELLNVPHVPEFKRIIDRNITPNTFRQCTSQDDIKPVNINNIKQAVREVMNECAENPAPDEPAIKETKTNVFGEAMSAQEITTSFQNIRKALIEALKSIKENQTLNCEIKVDGKDFVKLFKKYNHTGGD